MIKINTPCKQGVLITSNDSLGYDQSIVALVKNGNSHITEPKPIF